MEIIPLVVSLIFVPITTLGIGVVIMDWKNRTNLMLELNSERDKLREEINKHVAEANKLRTRLVDLEGKVNAQAMHQMGGRFGGNTRHTSKV